ncbi:unnamed protein product [Mytilus coruscus]|uniref:Uncharacterized protein n=1 Tax=Mytilus coruscus TaxID=42192 RepID=A0A6J8DLU6_MYTCO|nr:unnamed protein product [Mytilus coruscus]
MNSKPIKVETRSQTVKDRIEEEVSAKLMGEYGVILRDSGAKSNDIDARKEKISVCETHNLPHDVDRTSGEYSKSKRYLKAMNHTGIVVFHVEDCLKEINNVENTDSAESLQSFKDHLQTSWAIITLKLIFLKTFSCGAITIIRLVSQMLWTSVA